MQSQPGATPTLCYRTALTKTRSQQSTSESVIENTPLQCISPKKPDSKHETPRSPGALAQRFAQRVAADFVKIKPKNVHNNLLSPESAKMVIQSAHSDAAIDSLFDGSVALDSNWALNARTALGRRRLNFLESVKKGWIEKPDSAGVHNKLAEDEVLFRTLSDRILSCAGRSVLQRLKSVDLSKPEFQMDLNDLKQAVFDVSGDIVDRPSDLWRYLTVRELDGKPSGKNVLITVVKLNNETRLRFLSVSGGFIPAVHNGNTVIKVMGNADNSQLHAVPLSPSRHHSACSVQANMRDLSAPGQPGVRYLGYNDLLVGRRYEQCEARLMPRTLTLSHGGLHDRARDTEYSVLNALIMILQHNSSWQNQALDIRMFSRLPMCHACQNAATHAILDPVLSGLRSFRIYGAGS